MRIHRIPNFALLILSAVLASVPAHAFSVLGNTETALVGNDLTDLPGLTMFASSKPYFGNEGAFDVFNNMTGESADKWCCFFGTDPEYVGIILPSAYQLTSFTVTSANDVPARDPIVWALEGSNDTTTGADGTWTTIFDHQSGGSDWATREQVNRYSPGDGDVFLTTMAFSAFRIRIFETSLNLDGMVMQLDELELFGSPVPEPGTALLLGLGLSGLGIRPRRSART